MKQYKIVYTDNIYGNNTVEESYYSGERYHYVVAEKHDEASLIEACRDADAVMVSFAEITRPVIEAMENCKVIIRCGMGVNNVDIAAATEKKIPVANVQKYCLEEVSDHALALALMLQRRIGYMDRCVRSGIWDASRARPIHRLRGQTFGLYGLGAIANTLAQKAKALNFRVAAYDPYLPAEVFEKLGVERIEREEELFSQADILSIHIPLLPSTAKIITLEKLKKMKPSAILINTARGGLIDEEGLVTALRDGIIAGAGLDVLTEEYPSADHPLFALDNTIITPHYAYYSEESDIDLRSIACQQVIEALETGFPRYCLNRKEIE